MVTHSNILAWRTPRTEEPGGLSIGSQRVGHHRVPNTTHTHTHKITSSGFLSRDLLDMYLVLCPPPNQLSREGNGVAMLNLDQL